MNRIMGRGDREAVTVFCLFESPDYIMHAFHE